MDRDNCKPKYSKCWIKPEDAEKTMEEILAKFNQSYEANSKMRLAEAKRILQATQAELSWRSPTDSTYSEVRLNVAHEGLNEARQRVKKTLQTSWSEQQHEKLSDEEKDKLVAQECKRAADRAARKARGF